MKKEIGTFERKAHEELAHDLCVIMITIYVVLAIFILDVLVNKETLGAAVYARLLHRLANVELMYGAVLISWVLTLIIVFMPPDFKYCIMLDNGHIIFSYPDKEPDIISESFKVSKRMWYYLVLKDEEVEIKIPYNRKVLKVLKEIQK